MKINIKYKKIVLLVALALGLSLNFSPIIANALTFTEQAQEQGFDNFQPEGFDQRSREDTKGVEERGLVPCTLTECTFCHLLRLAERIFYWLLSLAFAVAVLFVVISGFIYILSIGDSGTMAFAKEGLKLSIVGFVICIASWLAIHIVYTVLGYKNGNWWQIECNSESSVSEKGNPEKKVAVNVYANEIDPDKVGGRNNPIALPDLVLQNLNDIPENKYFFIHGIGGQPLDKAAEQIEKVVAKAEENKTVVYAAVPHKDEKGITIGTRKVNLNSYLPAILSDIGNQESGISLPVNDQSAVKASSKSTDQFYDLLLNMLTKSITDEIPLIMAREGITPSDFNQIWPSVNWNQALGSGPAPKFEPSSSIISGLLYKEGDGPKLFDPDKFNGLIPQNDTHLSVNLNPDGSLNLANPVDIDQVAPGVTEQELRGYTQQVAKMLAKLQEQYKTQGKDGDFLTGMIGLLNQSVDTSAGGQDTATNTSEPEKTGKTATDKSGDGVGEETNDNNSKATNEDTSTADNSLDKEIEDLERQITLDSAWNTGGTGMLPNSIRKDSKDPREALLDKVTKKLEREMEDFIRNPGGTEGSGRTGGSNSNGSSSSGDRGEPSSSTGGTRDTSGTSGTGNNNDTSEPPGDWSGTSIGFKGQLSKDEIKRLDEEIIPKALKDLNLNVPADFVMCLINKESTFKPGAFNGNGERSIGLMQINTRAGTQNDALRGLKSYVNNNDPENIYTKLRRDVGTDQVLISDSGLLSQRDPAHERGITNTSLGIGYLKLINAKHGRGDGLKNYSDLDNLAAGYNCGPGGCKGGNTAYSRSVVNCTKTMQDKRNANGGQSPWIQSSGGKKK